LLFIFVVVTGGAAFGAYRLTRQVVAEAPIQLPQLPGVNNAKPTQPPAIAVNPTQPTQPLPPTAASVLPNNTTAPNPVTATPIIATNAAPVQVQPETLTRVNILVLGIDQRKGETGNFRTDTMIVLSLDPIRKTGTLISIPRDIYLQIPGTPYKNRINTAYDIGGQMNYPGGAAMLSVKTVQNVLGIKIHHFVVVNFDVFNAAIDALGTIQVCPKTAIHDDKYPDGSYGFMVVEFQPGCQELNSTRLLQYARVRHNAGDDFGRSERQQEVIKAVRDKVLSLGGVGALLTKAGSLWETVKTSVQTDMTFDQMVQLAQIAQAIPRDAITSAVLTDRDSYVLPATTAQGEQVFTPNYEKIHELMETLFSANPASK
jgi:LCP family protein required for cell wall assembly